MKVTLFSTPEADAQIRQIDAWWRKNRSVSPDLFLNELIEAFAIIEAAPLVGRRYRPSPVPGVRRVLLRACRYHLYYLPSDRDVIVLAVWHAQRGAGPPLRES